MPFDDTGGPPDPRPGDPTVELQVICTGNVARSPLAMVMLEHEARRRIGPDAPVWFTSSGVHGLEGEAAVAESRRLAAARGLSLERHRGAVTERDDLLRQDLVLTMTESQRSKVVRRAPAAARRVFTVRELARLCAALKPIEGDLSPRERVRVVVTLANGARPYVQRPSAPEDIADPFGRPQEAYDRVGRELDEAIGRIAPQLFGWLDGEDDTAPTPGG